jgi:CHAT domain-containing protein
LSKAILMLGNNFMTGSLHHTRVSWSAQALRNAQLSLLADPAYAHPFFWSPLLMINNWL